MTRRLAPRGDPPAPLRRHWGAITDVVVAVAIAELQHPAIEVDDTGDAAGCALLDADVTNIESQESGESGQDVQGARRKRVEHPGVATVNAPRSGVQ